MVFVLSCALKKCPLNLIHISKGKNVMMFLKEKFKICQNQINKKVKKAHNYYSMKLSQKT